jgi:dihydrofolate reductase
MSKVIVNATVSLDGFIARHDNSVGPLFDWYGQGDVEFVGNDPNRPFRVSRASADYLGRLWPSFAVSVVGRTLFDYTDGWGGVPPASDAVIVVTHRPADEWQARYPDAPFSFAGDVASAIAAARERAGDRNVSVTAGVVGGQALSLGLLDAVAMDVAPVVLGEGKRYFGDYAGADVLLRDPDIVQGHLITHLWYEIGR